MPFTPRIAVRQSTSELVFETSIGGTQQQFALNSMQNFRCGYGDLMYGELGFNDGGPGSNQYRMNAFTPDGYMNLYNGDIALGTEQPYTELVRGLLLAASSMSVFNDNWSMFVASAPVGYPVGDFDLGVWASTLTVPMTNPVASPDDIGFNDNIFPWPSFDSHDPAFGWLFYDTDQTFTLWAIKNGGTTPGAYKAFEVPVVIEGLGEINKCASWSDDTLIYTLFNWKDTTIGGSAFGTCLVEWTPSQVAFDNVNYTISLDDPDDQLLFEEINAGGDNHIYWMQSSDTKRIILTFWDASTEESSFRATSFAFNKDMTQYNKYTFDIPSADHPFPNTLWPSLFIDDIFNAKWLQISSPGASFVIPAGPAPEPGGTIIASLSGVNLYPLPCFTPCLPHAIKQL